MLRSYFAWPPIFAGGEVGARLAIVIKTNNACESCSISMFW
jgi:hypothetical protein